MKSIIIATAMLVGSSQLSAQSVPMYENLIVVLVNLRTVVSMKVSLVILGNMILNGPQVVELLLNIKLKQKFKDWILFLIFHGQQRKTIKC